MMQSEGYSIVSSSSPWGFFPIGIVLAIVAGVWVAVAASRFIQGGVVERPERVPQLYGYTACLIGLVWTLVSFVNLTGKLLTLGHPELSRAEYDFMSPSVSSFEAFRVTYERSLRFGPEGERKEKVDSIPEPELKRRYEAIRADRITQVEFQTRNAIITSLINLIVGSALFLFHWRWVKRRFTGGSPSPA